MSARRTAIRALVVAAGAVLLAGCSEPPAVPVDPPDVSIDSRAFCQHLDVLLPSKVDDQRTIPTTPGSRYTAAWGDPPVVMRCGVGQPAGLTPTSEVIEVNGVDWFLVETGDAYVFTTVNRAANVEVSVPGSVPRTEATAPLADLARDVRAAIPNAP